MPDICYADFELLIGDGDHRKTPSRTPKTTNIGINERMERYNLAEECSAFTPQVIALWGEILEDKTLPYVLRLQAAVDGSSLWATSDADDVQLRIGTTKGTRHG